MEIFVSVRVEMAVMPARISAPVIWKRRCMPGYDREIGWCRYELHLFD